MVRTTALRALASQHHGDAHQDAAKALESDVEALKPEELVQHFAQRSNLFGKLLATAPKSYVRDVLSLLEDRRGVPRESLIAAARCDWDSDAARVIAWRLRRMWVCSDRAPVRCAAENCQGDPTLLRILARHFRDQPVALARLAACEVAHRGKRGCSGKALSIDWKDSKKTRN